MIAKHVVDFGEVAAHVAIWVYTQRNGPVLPVFPNAFRISNTLYTIHNLGLKCLTIYTRLCNGETYPGMSVKLDNLEKRIAALALGIGITAELQTDPRGWPVILHVGTAEYRLGGR